MLVSWDFFFGRVIFFGQKTTCLPKWLAMEFFFWPRSLLVGIFFSGQKLRWEFVSGNFFFAKGVLPGLGLGAGTASLLPALPGEGRGPWRGDPLRRRQSPDAADSKDELPPPPSMDPGLRRGERERGVSSQASS